MGPGRSTRSTTAWSPTGSPAARATARSRPCERCSMTRPRRRRVESPAATRLRGWGSLAVLVAGTSSRRARSMSGRSSVALASWRRRRSPHGSKLAAFTGLRPGELDALRRVNVDPARSRTSSSSSTPRRARSRLGISQPRVVELESGEKNPQIETLVKLQRRPGSSSRSMSYPSARSRRSSASPSRAHTRVRWRLRARRGSLIVTALSASKLRRPRIRTWRDGVRVCEPQLLSLGSEESAPRSRSRRRRGKRSYATAGARQFRSFSDGSMGLLCQPVSGTLRPSLGSFRSESGHA